MEQELAYTIFEPTQSAKAAVLIVHGMAEHRRRYASFAQYLADLGYGVLTYDLPGHGDTPKECNGFFAEEKGWDVLIDSVVHMRDVLQERFPGVPVVLFAHSMGTMIARTYLQEHDDGLAGVILSGAPNYNGAVRFGKSLGSFLKKTKGARNTSALMDKMTTGSFNSCVKKPKTKNDWLSYNEENVERYNSDPMCGFGFTIQGYLDEFEGMERMNRADAYGCRRPDMPIRFIAGADDPCTGGEKGLQSSMDVLKAAGYTNLQIKRYPHMRHEILNETGREEVWRDAASYVKESAETSR